MSASTKGSRHYSPRSRNRHSHSRDSYYSYSDSFASDSDEDKQRTRKRPAKPKTSTGPISKTKSKKPPGKGKATKPAVDMKNVDQVTQRMLSARRHRINDLVNENDDLNHQIAEAKDEMKLMKVTQRRQEKALYKFEGQEGDLSNLLSRHNEEVRSLKDQIRKYRGKLDHSRRSYQEVSDDLFKAKSELKKMKDLVDSKELREREDLDRKLTNAEVELDSKDKRIRELERHTEHLIKNHKHEMAIEQHRHKDTRAHLDSLKRQVSEYERQLSEKTKLLDLGNIYSNHRSKPPHHLPSPAPSSRRPLYEKESTATPREKIERARLYEQKRREKAKQRQKRDEQKKEPERLEEDDCIESPADEPEWHYERAHHLKFSFNKDSGEKSECDSDTKKTESPRMEKMIESPVIEKYEPTLEKESPQHVKQRIATPPKPKTPEPVKDPEPFAIIQFEKADPVPETPLETAEEAEKRRKKEILLARLKAMDEANETDEEQERIAAASSKPRYSFSKPVDNLHHGLPSHEDVKVPYLERQKRRSIDSNSSSSMKNHTRPQAKDEKKNDLMDTLFGNSEETTNERRKDTTGPVFDYSGYQPSVSKPSRHQPTAIAKPVVTAVDDIHEDEIEEFIL